MIFMSSYSSNDKFERLYLMLSRWWYEKNLGFRIDEKLLELGYKSIAIYGMSLCGIILMQELRESGVKVSYGIDRNATMIYTEVPVYLPDEELEPVDLVVVTCIDCYDQVVSQMKSKLDADYKSIEDIIYSV